jgi:glycosyltransferase involved in cell wall biosynthesis
MALLDSAGEMTATAASEADVSQTAANPLVFVWENLGPMHVDRCEAVARRFAGRRKVVGIEIASRSVVYDWESPSAEAFEKVTLYEKELPRSFRALRIAARLTKQCLAERSRDVFLCNYDHPATFATAIALRLLGRRVYTMGPSKFDDYPRNLWREVLKSFFYLPYCGGISSGKRARDYMRFLGIRSDRISTEYNTVSIDRIRALAGVDPAPGGTPFRDRHLTIVARFVPKKNLSTALRAYAIYRRTAADPRPLHLCGSGPLEQSLRQLASELGLQEHVAFRGFLQTADVAKVLGRTLAILLPSVEEQFGNVVIEAQAMGLPVIVSDNCGARDRLVRTGVNGFVVEPDNPEGMAFFATLLSDDEELWRRMCFAAQRSAPLGDVERFADAVSGALAAAGAG